MKEAIKQAKKAYEKEEIPVGAVIVKDNKVVSVAYNRKNIGNNSLFHAEILAISKACKKLKSWRLNDCDIYITLEPCQMCYFAIVEARISNIYYMVDSNYINTLKNFSKNINKVKVHVNYEYKNLLNNFFERNN